MRRILLLATLLAGYASTGYASPIVGQISLSGSAEAVGSVGMGSATGIDFASGSSGTISGSSGGLNTFGAGSGTFGGLACVTASAGCGTIQDILAFASEPATNTYLTFVTGGPLISFDLSSITGLSYSQNGQGGSVTFTADGTIDFLGYDPTPGTFILTAQGDNIVEFSATLLADAVTSPVPEPASLATFGVAILGVGASRFGRKRG